MKGFLSDASFWMPDRLIRSAWIEHAPFGFWIVQAHKPRVLVELGTHTGFSYLVFCQALQRFCPDARAFAVDTWEGDEHTGFYGEEVFETLSEYHHDRYSGFSRLVRSTFDDAVNHFDDAAVDLLHIDGRHFLDDVKHDFETWKPKLSDRAVVLLHDTNVRERGFGVHKFWEELRKEYPHFEFVHGHGLGVLGVGPKQGDSLEALFTASADPTRTAEIRQAYARLGAGLADRLALFETHDEVASSKARTCEIDRALKARSADVARLKNEITAAKKRSSGLQEKIADRTANVAQLKKEVSSITKRASALAAANDTLGAKAARLESELSSTRRRMEVMEARLENPDTGSALARGDAAPPINGIAEVRAPLGADGPERAYIQSLVSAYHKQSTELRSSLRQQATELVRLRRQLDDIAARSSRNIVQRIKAKTGAAKRVIQSICLIPILKISGKFDPDRRRLETAELVRSSGLFDQKWYLENYRDVANTGCDPVEHYLEFGAAEGRNPNAVFDSDWYMERNSDVQATGLNPLVHYLKYGAAEGRNPAPDFDSEYYISQHRELVETGENPLIHYFNSEASRQDAVLLAAAKHVKGALGDGNQFAPSYTRPSERGENTMLVIGNIDRAAENSTIAGWVYCAEEPISRAITIRLDNDEDFLATADILRADLVGKGFGDGRYGFDFVPPISYFDGRPHAVDVIDKETGQHVIGKEMRFVHDRRFVNFDGFLKRSLLNPVLYGPFREEDKRCFAVMENIARHLCSLERTGSQDELVSIVMPVYNRSAVVGAAIESVLAQTYKNFELIVVDDNSDDNSAEVIESYDDPRIRAIRSDERLGVSGARNRALQEAQGQIIAYLDSDNTWSENYLLAMTGAFHILPDADALYCAQALFRRDAEAPFAVRFGSFNPALLGNRNYIDLNCFVHRREAIERAGHFDEELRRFVDWDLILRIAETATIYSIPVLLSNYYYDKAVNTISNDVALARQGDLVRQKRVERRKGLPAGPVGLRVQVTVVIASYQARDDLERCLLSVRENYTPQQARIIVVDNASQPDVVDFLLAQEKKDPEFKVILNDINYGFTYAVNQGIAASEAGQDIVVLNNDALVTAGALEALQEVVLSDPDVAVAVPQQVLYARTKTIGVHVPFAWPDHDCDVNLSVHHDNIEQVPMFHSGRTVNLNFAPFFCAYIRRSALDGSVQLDAQFGRHYRSDRIMCDFVRHVLGQKIVYVAAAVVYHRLQRSTDELRSDEDRQKEFDDIFNKNRWPKDLADSLGFEVPFWDRS
ncbi:MAG: glycosyltransferase [Rhodospirillales bacterium]|nr:MAG: glycosyltransferase [Rhodospirillales bacterium]